MLDHNVTAMFARLPEHATNEEALFWIERIRRVLNRWEELPADETHAMTPELAQQAMDELDEMERLIHRDLSALQSA